MPGGDYEVPIVIQDRKFSEDGSLFYPSTSPIPTAPVPSVIPVLIGDITLVNGKTWPFFEVEPRKYRFRVLNGSNSRPYRVKTGMNNSYVPFFPFFLNRTRRSDPVIRDVPLKNSQELLRIDFQMLSCH